MRAFVTGAAGFLGSHLMDRLLADGHTVTGFDKHWPGQDLLQDPIDAALRGSDVVFHCAALASLRIPDPEAQVRQNLEATLFLLAAMARQGVNRIVFASTAAVYGDTLVFPTPETAPFPMQTSLYAAAKVSSEAFLTAYASTFGFRVGICRFVSLLGERYHYGHVADFVQKLAANPHAIEVLGNGHQRKAYVYVKDAVSAMMLLATHPVHITIVNVSSGESLTVNQSLDIVCDELGVTPERTYTGGVGGWVGDHLVDVDCSRLKALGWKPKWTLEAALRKTVRYCRDYHTQPA